MTGREANFQPSSIRWGPRSAEVAWDDADKTVSDDGTLHVTVDDVVLFIERAEKGAWSVKQGGRELVAR